MAGLRAGFVGLGWWGRELAGAAARTAGALLPAAGYSPDPAEARAFAQQFGVALAGSYAALLADTSIDAVVIATPHSLHADQIVAAARAGKHVFVEKPLAVTGIEARRAIATCADAGVVLAVGHNRRLLAPVDQMKLLLDQGVTGRIGLVEANYSTPEALRLPPGHWRRDPRECPGGAMTAIGIHMIDWMHVLFGRVAEARALFASRAAEPAMQDTATATLVFESGLLATLVCLYAAPYVNRFVIHGSAARIAVEASAAETEALRPTLTLTHTNGRAERSEIPYGDTLALQLQRFAEACQGKGAAAVTGIDAARNVAVLEAVTLSAGKNGAAVVPDYAGLWD
jgi:predicted dehydrogenase